jgi:hypothetical protein
MTSALVLQGAMGVIRSLFPEDPKDGDPENGDPHDGDPKDGEEPTRIGLMLLCQGALPLPGEGWQTLIRAYHPELAEATVRTHRLEAQGSPVALIRWGDHVVEAVGFDAPMPADALDPCLQLSHYDQARKERARRHRSHWLLWETSHADPLERCVAVAAVCGALAGEGAIAVVNEVAQTTLPVDVLAKTDEDDMLELLRSLPLPLLYVGFAKYTVEGEEGVWMRTWAAHTLGLPDLALLATGHERGQDTMDLFENVLRYAYNSGSQLGAGHTMQVGEDTFARLRSPRADEPFLESAGTMLVITISGGGIDSWPGRH